MRKRARQTSAKSRKKVKIPDDLISQVPDDIPEDLISQVPDDILLDIISRLTVREAARTSVLSSRWKYLWTFITNLDFEPPKSVLVTSKTVVQRIEERSKYIDWVNKVLKLHEGLSVNQFRISFDLVGCHGSSITNWIYKAMSKNVQMFELNLRRAWYRKMTCEQYTFPEECYNSLKNSDGLYGIKSLRSLRLFGVNVTGQILQFFIHNCPLDRLSVAYSHNLRRLKVVGSSIRLKYLEIFKCTVVKEVKISAPSLLSFKYKGSKIKLNIENVSQLVDLSIGWESSGLELKCIPDQLLNYFPRLTNLELGFRLDKIFKELSHPQLPNLRHLTLDFSPCNREGILLLTSIIDACPFLQKLSLKLSYYSIPAETEIHQIPENPLRRLKVLELFLFRENAIELKIVSYLLKDATLLEKLIVKASTGRTGKIARESRKLLGPKLPKGVQLIVLKL